MRRGAESITRDSSPRPSGAVPLSQPFLLLRSPRRSRVRRVRQRELQKAFRNVSAVMDCVGCEKCKLWGKLQVLGLGTALKVRH